MIESTLAGVEILLWPTSSGLSAFAAPWVFDLEYDDRGRATIDACFYPLNVGNYPQTIDRYRALDGPGRARVLKAALARREDYLRFPPGSISGYLVRHHQPGIGELAFLEIVGAFVRTWQKDRREG